MAEVSKTSFCDPKNVTMNTVVEIVRENGFKADPETTYLKNIEHNVETVQKIDKTASPSEETLERSNDYRMNTELECGNSNTDFIFLRPKTPPLKLKTKPIRTHKETVVFAQTVDNIVEASSNESDVGLDSVLDKESDNVIVTLMDVDDTETSLKSQSESLDVPLNLSNQNLNLLTTPVNLSDLDLSLAPLPVNLSNQNLSLPTEPMTISNQNLSLPTAPMTISNQNISLPTEPKTTSNQNLSLLTAPVNLSNQNHSLPTTPVNLSDQNLIVPTPPGCSRELYQPKTSIYTEDTGNKWYKVTGTLVTPPIVPKKLPDAFGYLPIYGRPMCKSMLPEFQTEKIREFVGFDLSDEEFDKLENYCSPDLLKTGSEIKMMTKTPKQPVCCESEVDEDIIREVKDYELCTVKKLKLRIQKDSNNRYPIKLKYRGLKMMPLSELQDGCDKYESTDELLEPGKDLIFRIRIYRGFPYNLKDRYNRSRHSIFSHDVVLTGRAPLTALRDRIVCANDADLRVDLSARIHHPPPTTAKDVFPSGFLFINNVFYRDTRAGCRDISQQLRHWAQRRGLGTFPVKDMGLVTLDQLVLKLGHPEVYVHQGNCEHLFTFSEIRLLGPSDPMRPTSYPTHTAVAQNQTVYCTTCAEYSAKWIVIGCDMVPFDPAYFCDLCLKTYLYRDGMKIGEFKAYSYKGNEINLLKPTG